jgi:aryl-alcohol dehydrogenase-like predicted oxidoreductase
MEWLREALQEVEQVKFLAGEETGRTLAQAAIKFALYQPTIVSVLPNFTNLDELQHYTDAVDVPDITDSEQSLLDDLWEYNFDLEEAPVNLTEV